MSWLKHRGILTGLSSGKRERGLGYFWDLEYHRYLTAQGFSGHPQLSDSEEAKVPVCDLQEKAAEIAKELQQETVTYLTYKGRTIGVLLPVDVDQETQFASGRSAWENLELLGEEIGRGWKSSKTSDQLLNEMRR